MTASLLRPHQREEMVAERETLERKLINPNIEDKGTVRRQMQQLDRQLETQTPKPFTEKEIDSAVKLEGELREQILTGMPSQEEMRKCPPGAIDKHRQWEKRNKAKLVEWKNLMLRLNAGTEDRDVANFEKYRPVTSNLNMDNAVIQGKQYFMPPTSPEYRENFDRIFPEASYKKPRKKPGPKKKVVEEQPSA